MASGDDFSARRKVPVRLNEFSVLDSEFDNIRSRFDNEMKKMEDEMNKFRSEMLNRDGPFVGGNKTSSMSSSSRFMSSECKKTVNGKEVFGEKTSSESMSTTNQGDTAGDLLPGGGLGSHRNWLHGLESPLIKDEGGQKEIKLRFDVSQYTPEEIMVKTVDNKLLVHAKHEEEKEGKSVFREYNREFLLPAGTDPETIRSSLSKDGILTVEAPLPQPALTQEKKK